MSSNKIRRQSFLVSCTGACLDLVHVEPGSFRGEYSPNIQKIA